MSKESPPSRTAEQFVVRFPNGMRDQIAEEAKKNNRSMNAEIVARLQASFGGNLQGSLGSLEMTGQMGSDAAFTPQQVTLMKEVAAEVAKQVVLRFEGVDLVSSGQARIVLSPPPEPEAKPAKKPT